MHAFVVRSSCSSVAMQTQAFGTGLNSKQAQQFWGLLPVECRFHPTTQLKHTGIVFSSFC